MPRSEKSIPSFSKSVPVDGFWEANTLDHGGIIRITAKLLVQRREPAKALLNASLGDGHKYLYAYCLKIGLFNFQCLEVMCFIFLNKVLYTVDLNVNVLLWGIK